MGYGGQGLVIGACRENAQIAIDLHGVRIDNDAVEGLRHGKREAGLTARRRPGDQNGRLGVHAEKTSAATPLLPLISSPGSSNT